MAEVKIGRVALVTLLLVVVAVWFPSWRWFALGLAVPLALFLLFSAVIRIHKLRHRRPMKWMNRPRYVKIFAKRQCGCSNSGRRSVAWASVRE
jgi:uncharacterized membrane protein YqjE